MYPEADLCIPVYVAAKEFTNLHNRYLKQCGITFTQYIVMIILWEQKELLVKEIGKRLALDSGTLTPVLKKLEEKNFVNRRRSKEDARDVIITLTEEGELLKETVKQKHEELYAHLKLTDDKRKRIRSMVVDFVNILEEMRGNEEE